tara:strand:+ start:22 stop:882 length:861 start_codon:yes stop_codon:yes gene_type:complete
MATVNLGKIKLKWRGTWSSGASYTIDDVVSYTDGSVTSSYIAVAASQNQAPSTSGTANSSYWNFLAKGQATSPTTTQGDLIVRGASADERLAIGSAGQALKVNSSANGLEYGLAGGLLQAKQWVKRSSIDNNNQSDSVLASPFDGTARITPSAAGNMIKVTYFNTIDHGTNWRSNKLRLDYSIDGGSNYHGIAGCSISSGDGSNTMHGNNACMTVMFNPNTTNEVRVRVVTNGHNNGAGRFHGQYNNEGGDGSSHAPDAPSGTIAAGHGILLEEYSSQIATFTAIS